MKKNLWPICLLLVSCLFLAGCTTTITNLTPSTAKRNASGLYAFEVLLDSTQQSIKKDTFKPFVIIGKDSYPMQPTMGLKNRWETLIPISADKEFINYQFKFNYDYRSIPKTRPDSKLSAPYQLQILDK